MELFRKIKKGENLILLSPEREFLREKIQTYISEYKVSDTLFLASSGTTSRGESKVYEISHKMMLGHAESLCSHFSINSKSDYVLSLPTFFMGGCSILYRQIIAGFRIHEHLPWNASLFPENGKWTSLIPTQVFDLINQGKDLSHYDGIFIGGSKLNRSLKAKLSSGIKFLTTYGATEFCSQLATGKSGNLTILPWVKMKIQEDRLLVRSPFHFKKLLKFQRGRMSIESYESFLIDGYFPTEDRAMIHGSILEVQGRFDRTIKINGKMYNLDFWEDQIEKLGMSRESFFLTYDLSERQGKVPLLIILKEVPIKPFESLGLKFDIRSVPQFYYTASGKLIKNLSVYET